MRLLLLLVLAMLVIHWARSVFQSFVASAAAESDPAVAPPVKNGRLVACSVCGVHVVESRTLAKATPTAPVLCSEACQQRARAAS